MLGGIRLWARLSLRICLIAIRVRGQIWSWTVLSKVRLFLNLNRKYAFVFLAIYINLMTDLGNIGLNRGSLLKKLNEYSAKNAEKEKTPYA